MISMGKKGRHEKIRDVRAWVMGPWVTALSIFIVAGVIALLCVYMQPGSLADALSGFLQQPLLIPLNYFPALVSTALLYFVLNNVFFAGAVSGGVMTALSYISLLKYEGREDTLVPADILLFKEAIGAVRDYQLELHWGRLAAIAALVLFLMILGIFIKSAVLRRRFRIAGALAALLVFALSVEFIYTDKKLYNDFRVPSRYNIGSVYNTLGFNYCFLYNFRLYPVDRPAGYSRAEAESWNAVDPANANPLDFQPNVIIVMCEAFSDLSAEDVFTYSEQDNPLYEYDLACDSELALHGHIVVTNYGAGTANTEFDVMTGMQTDMIGEETTSAFRVVRKRTDSLATVLSKDGYGTLFMHPGQSWFYNRNSVYAHLGITDQVFKDAFDETDLKGTRISDAAFLDELKSDIERMESPLFIYSVTIQNHQAYPWDKYDVPVPAAEVSVPLSDSAMEQLSVYLEGVRDSSRMLLDLTAYLDTLSEPTLLVFFGDHRPNIGSTDTELGLAWSDAAAPEEIVASFSVPFLIRANAAFGERVDIPAAFDGLRLPENHIISDNYLGGVILTLTGHNGENAFFDYLNTLRLELPVLRAREGVYARSDGTLTTSLTPEEQAMVDRLSRWTYYRLR